MTDCTPCIDIDRHVLEPMAMWREYLPRRARNLAPEVVTDPDWPPQSDGVSVGGGRLPIICVEGRSIWADMGDAAREALAPAALRRSKELVASTNPAGHLADMDGSGIDAGVIFPTYASYLVHDDGIDAHISRTYAHAYNAWMDDFASSDPLRLCPAFLVSAHDPGRMVEDLEAGQRRRRRPVMLRPNPILNRTLADRVYDPFWEACESLQIPIFLHEGTHARVSTVGRYRFQTRFGKHACSHPMEMMMALVSLLEGGVLERHPGLHFAILEAGCGWLPYWLWRLDHVEYGHLKSEVGDVIRMPPSDYVRRQCWFAIEPGEALLSQVIGHVGADRFLVGTDFPHLDHELSGVRELGLESGECTDRLVAQLTWHNPRRLLGEGFLDMERLQARNLRGR